MLGFLLINTGSSRLWHPPSSYLGFLSLTCLKLQSRLLALFPYSLLNVCKVCSDVPSFFPNWSFVSSFNLDEGLSISLIFAKNQLLIPFIFSFLYFVDFHTDFYYCLPPTYFAFNILLFFSFLNWKLSLVILGLSSCIT